ncbi:hypothetical protein ABIB16_001913 [Micrococcus sp. UYEF5]
MSRFQMLSRAQWELITPRLPTRTGRAGRPFTDARTMVEAIIYRYRYRCFDSLEGPARGLRALADRVDLAPPDGGRGHLGHGADKANRRH